MNYIWDMLIRAKKLGIQKEDITFIKAKVYSPYMELAFDELNTVTMEDLHIEVNPYYRYDQIFGNMFHPDFTDNLELRNVLFDLLIHHLADTDAYMGMNQQEFYQEFIFEDIKNNCFGRNALDKLNKFNDIEKQIILNHIIKLYKLGESIQLLKEIVPLIFKSSSIYINKKNKDEILIYLGEKKQPENEEKLKLLLDFFMPVKYSIRVYWDKHFGIIDADETMKVDAIVLY